MNVESFAKTNQTMQQQHRLLLARLWHYLNWKSIRRGAGADKQHTTSFSIKETGQDLFVYLFSNSFSLFVCWMLFFKIVNTFHLFTILVDQYLFLMDNTANTVIHLTVKYSLILSVIHADTLGLSSVALTRTVISAQEHTA